MEAPKTIAELIERTRDAYAEFSAAIGAFPEETLTAPGTIGDWSVRINLATQDGRNAWQRDRLRDLSLADVHSMASEAHARLLAVIATLKDSQLAEELTIAELKTVGHIRKPREGETCWPLEQWLGGVTYRHFADHTEALCAVAGKQEQRSA